MMKYSSTHLTETGLVKLNNEDRLYANDGKRVYLICDGMGGEACGEVAAEIAVDVALCHEADLIALPNSDSIKAYVHSSNEKILEKSCELGYPVMGTTFAWLEFVDDCAYAFSVGDSRIYRLRDGLLEQLTEDHTMVYRMYLDGVISKEEARLHPRSHVLYQHLGMPEQSGEPVAYVAEPCPVIPGDVYLACSDGLSDMLSDEEICHVILQKGTIDEAADELMKRAIAAGGKDNISMILVEAEAEQTILDKVGKSLNRMLMKRERKTDGN